MNLVGLAAIYAFGRVKSPPSDNNSIFGVQQVHFFRLCFAIKDSEMLKIFQIYHTKFIRIWLLQKNC